MQILWLVIMNDLVITQICTALRACVVLVCHHTLDVETPVEYNSKPLCHNGTCNIMFKADSIILHCVLIPVILCVGENLFWPEPPDIPHIYTSLTFIYHELPPT